jgi:hypothetical protein
VADRAKAGRKSPMGVEWRYEIKVPRDEFEQAQLVLDTGADAGERSDGMELPASPCVTQDFANSRTYLAKLQAEDAVVEIFSKDPENQSSIVELSLRTNLIRFRTEVLDDGSVKLFVLPEDETRAREIVREMKESKPPE